MKTPTLTEIRLRRFIEIMDILAASQGDVSDAAHEIAETWPVVRAWMLEWVEPCH